MIKSLLSGFIFLFIATIGLSQQVLCPPDTIGYTLEKTTYIDSLTLDPHFTPQVYQYFETPQEISISGARFHGFKRDTTNGDSMWVVVELRRATPDSVPGTFLYASDTVMIGRYDSLQMELDSFEIDATWNPVDVDENYCIVIKADTTGDYVIFHNKRNGTAPDGQEEWLAGVYQGVSWIKGDVYQPSAGQPFDADWLIEPFVRYSIGARFINDPECLFDEQGEVVQFTNTGAEIADHRMYNKFAYFNSALRQTWNFGDGSGPTNLVNPAYFYPTNGPYVATMQVKILHWDNESCESSTTQIIKERPDQNFEYENVNLDVKFTNKTVGSYSSIHYDFGDGNSSTNENPEHKYAKPGTYWVCQTMETSCGEIMQCKNVAVATNTTLNCGKDSVLYTAARGTGTKTMPLRNFGAKKLFGIGQRFDAPQSMIVHGFSFYANHNWLFRDSYPVECKIYYANAGLVPEGNALSSTTVHINKHIVDTLYNDTTKYTAIFNKPVNITKGEKYIMTIEYDSNATVLIGTTDWEEGDGDLDYLAVGKVNDSTWVLPTSVGVFGPADNSLFDADVLIEPLVEYNFDANFTYDFIDDHGFGRNCMLELPGSYAFENLSSEVVGSKIYNKLVFDSTQVAGYEWDYGDSTGIFNQVNGFHFFTGTGPFDVTLTINLQGWTTECTSTQTLNVPVPPSGGFSYEKVTSAVQFADSSLNADEYLWTFSDGTKSTLASPIHYFTQVGTFEVCQYVSNMCGSDTICDSITINVLGIPEASLKNIQIYPNPAQDVLIVNGELPNNDELTLSIFDLSGRMIRTETFSEKVFNQAINVSDLARGTYMLKLNAGEYEGVRKFILN